MLVPLLLRSRKERRDREAKENAERLLPRPPWRPETAPRNAAAFTLMPPPSPDSPYGSVPPASGAEARREAAAQRDEARYNEGLAWMLRAEVAEERSKRYPDTLLYAAQAIGFEGVGRPPDAELPLRYIPPGREAFAKAAKWIADRPAYRPVWASPLQNHPSRPCA